MKRFYQAVAIVPVGAGWQVTLDGRALKTVGRAPQVVPTQPLARALANEWEAQGERIDPHSFPARDLVDYAIDMVAPDPGAVIDKLLAYGDTDTLLYRADPDEPFHPRQSAVWEPIVCAFEQRHAVDLVRVSGIVHRPQSAATLARLRGVLATHDPFVLAGIEAMTTLAASLVVGLSALDPQADSPALWQAASLEEEWQAELWGREQEAEERRARRRADFLRNRALTLLALNPVGA